MAYQPLLVILCQSYSPRRSHSWEDKGIHTFPNGICPKVNVIARLEFELTYYDSAVHRYNHYTTRTPTRSAIIVSEFILCIHWMCMHISRPFIHTSSPTLSLSFSLCLCLYLSLLLAPSILYSHFLFLLPFTLSMFIIYLWSGINPVGRHKSEKIIPNHFRCGYSPL